MRRDISSSRLPTDGAETTGEYFRGAFAVRTSSKERADEMVVVAKTVGEISLGLVLGGGRGGVPIEGVDSSSGTLASSSSSPPSSSSSSKRRSFDAVAARNTSLANASFRSLLVCHTGASCFAVLKKKELKSPAKASAVFLRDHPVSPPSRVPPSRASPRLPPRSPSPSRARSRSRTFPFAPSAARSGPPHAVGGFVPVSSPARSSTRVSHRAAFASATPEDDDTVADVVVVAAADALVTAADAASDARLRRELPIAPSLNSTSRLAWRSRKASHSARRRAFSSSATRSASSARSRSRGGDVVAVAVGSIPPNVVG